MKARLRYLVLFIAFSHNIIAQQDTVIEPVNETYDASYDEEANQEDRGEIFLSANNMSDSLVHRKLPDSLVRKMKEDDDFWYANANIPKINLKKESKKPLTMRPWFQTLLWVVIIVGFASFLIWYLAGNNIGLFKKKRTFIDEPSVEEELSTEDLFAINYQREIAKAVGQGNYRLAVRLMFLRLLKNLAEKNIIEYRQGKTNFDYLQQLQTTGYYPDFFRITRNYEYSWYGQFEVGEDKFVLIKKEFDHFEKRLYR